MVARLKALYTELQVLLKNHWSFGFRQRKASGLTRFKKSLIPMSLRYASQSRLKHK